MDACTIWISVCQNRLLLRLEFDLDNVCVHLFIIHLVTLLSVHPAIHTFSLPTHLSIAHPHILPSIHLSIQSTIHPSLNTSIHSTIHPTIHLSIYQHIHPLNYPSIYPPTHPPIIHPPIYLPVHLSIHSFTRPSPQPLLTHLFSQQLHGPSTALSPGLGSGSKPGPLPTGSP